MVDSLHPWLGIFLLALCLAAPTTASYPLVVAEVPDFVRPYVLPYLTEPGVQLVDDIIRFPITNNASGGAFTLARYNGKVSSITPTHYHSRYHETWFAIKGRVSLWAGQETRILSPHDFGTVPTFNNHSFATNEPDSEFISFITPGGFDPFYLSIAVPWANPSNAPFPPDRPMPGVSTEGHEGAIYDYWPINYTLNTNVVNGTSDKSVPWHTGNNTLPKSDLHPYYVAANWGPKYLQRSLGQVVAPLMTPEQSTGKYLMTIMTVVMRRKLANETIATQKFDKPQAFVVLEGVLLINMMGQNVSMSTGDVAFVPANIDFQYWSNVAFTKFYLGSNGLALGAKLMEEGEDWNYAVFPSYLG